MRKLIQIIMVLFVVFVVYTSVQARQIEQKSIEVVPAPVNPYDTAHRIERKNPALADKMANGFVKALEREGAEWYECGKSTPREQWSDRASKLADSLLSAMGDYDTKINPWGVWGVVYNESRGNRCAIGPNPRKTAYRKRLIEKKNWRLWTEKEVLGVMSHRSMRKRPADLGVGQVVWKKFARLKENGIVRVPTVEEMLSIDAGMKVVAYSMWHRTKYKYNYSWKRMPWLFWPGRKPHLPYGRQIAMIVKNMGGPYRQVLGHKKP